MTGRKIKTFAVLLPLALTACGGGDTQQNIAALDNEIGVNGADPALMSALGDQIMVDPQLAAQSNKDAIRPPSQPYSAQLPAETVAAGKAAMPKDGELMKAPAPTKASSQAFAAQEQAITLGGMAARQKNPRTAGCAAKLGYSAGWAARMPADMPLHPQARVVEAAGTQADGCSLRAVSFSTPQPLQTMIDWYYTRAMKGGYSAEHQLKDGQHLLGGTRGRDGAAFVAFLSARDDGGTDIDLIADGAK
ncbi:hypothetical protein [Sphingomonas turrisvirgatae]|uniref:SCP domain-containing protein n=1 Tax=Sphingomonas turrisvirgatae TaxID=1888892 RepID=A0A1E3LZZ9_9SPHN|nr:hypothetical protein [Sphingomonas turrisvirgatae]ODP38665.1 hypothetical protein BFL28_01125 [Sphingomonas turrisvirgatae]